MIFDHVFGLCMCLVCGVVCALAVCVVRTRASFEESTPLPTHGMQFSQAEGRPLTAAAAEAEYVYFTRTQL